MNENLDQTLSWIAIRKIKPPTWNSSLLSTVISFIVVDSPKKYPFFRRSIQRVAQNEHFFAQSQMDVSLDSWMKKKERKISANCQTLSSNREENFSHSITMGKFQNFELNEEQRRIQLLKHQQRMDLRAQFWKNMTDPHRHGTGEGGHMVNIRRKNFIVHITSRFVCACVMSSNFVYLHRLSRKINNFNCDLPETTTNLMNALFDLIFSLTPLWCVSKRCESLIRTFSSQRVNQCFGVLLCASFQLLAATFWPDENVMKKKGNTATVKFRMRTDNSNSSKLLLFFFKN